MTNRSTNKLDLLILEFLKPSYMVLDHTVVWCDTRVSVMLHPHILPGIVFSRSILRINLFIYIFMLLECQNVAV